jgi:hypothetical protein
LRDELLHQLAHLTTRMDATNHNRPDDRAEIEAPPKLVAALQRLQFRRVFVPPTLDEAILSAAQRRLGRSPRATWSWFRFRLVWSGLAAACVIVAGMLYLFLKPLGPDRGVAREDVNRDGRVDILDAFQLARQVKSGGASPGLDLNGDGVIDHRDAEVIAARAVKLEKGGRS